MMEAVWTAETSVNSYQSTLRYNPEDNHLQIFFGSGAITFSFDIHGHVANNHVYQKLSGNEC
jgi:hypothetical protein